MIAPIHLAAGALSQRASKHWYLWVPLAFASHQVLDWTNGHLWHELNPDKLVTTTPWPFIILTIVGGAAIFWYGRRQWAGMLIATSPDIIDWLLAKAGHGPVHRWFWSARWQEPEWAFVWLAVAVLIFILILREKP